MRIRAITVGANARLSDRRVDLEPRISGFIEDARHRFHEAEIEVQTTRLASQPFTRIVPAERAAVAAFAPAVVMPVSGSGSDRLFASGI